ncbi:MAG TPA: sialidase family protein [Cyclobacteriaceae bacterium]|nr:sialidase family protein [Cyclobacteriaceae bacterium]
MKTNNTGRLMLGMAVAVIMASCSARPADDKFVTVFTATNATAPYFTSGPAGTVLCWTGVGPEGDMMYYATYNRQSGTFDAPIAVTPSRGTDANGERMNKVAFRRDGTVVAVFGRKHPTEKNKYASSILYTQSFDDGATWTEPKFVHSDTLEDNSRSFFDVAALPDGEVGVAWLDGRHRPGSEGSSLFFARTLGRDGFQHDQQVGETVCQCCRTAIRADPQGHVHIIYRDIEATVNGTVRDFAHIVSSDSGKTFSVPRMVSNDNWIVDGCPHTGASMSADSDRLEVVWFTAGGRPGLYYSFSSDGGDTFASREFISGAARHPQLASKGGQSVIVAEENEQHAAVTGGHEHHGDNTDASIVIYLRDHDGTVMKDIVDRQGGAFPVVTFIDDETLLIAYVGEGDVLVKKVDVTK